MAGKSNNLATEKLGKRLRAAREYRNMTTKEAAEQAGYSRQYIEQLEKDQKPLDMDKLNRFAKLYNVSTAFILGKSDIAGTYSDDITDLVKAKSADEILLRYLEATGHEIIFKTYRKHSPIANKYYYGTIDNLENFSFTDCHSYFSCNDFGRFERFEVLIEKVKFDDKILTFGAFSFFLEQIKHNITANVLRMAEEAENLIKHLKKQAYISFEEEYALPLGEKQTVRDFYNHRYDILGHERENARKLDDSEILSRDGVKELLEEKKLTLDSPAEELFTADNKQFFSSDSIMPNNF